jgi:hypothetical protein
MNIQTQAISKIGKMSDSLVREVSLFYHSRRAKIER